MRYLITGGTGFIGHHLVTFLFEQPETTLVRILSRDEYKQAEMRNAFEKEARHGGRLRFLLGDVRDGMRTTKAAHNIDVIIHAAALKRIEASEYDPTEFIKTNVGGTQNVIEAAITNQVAHVILISTDKSVEPLNTYGVTKLMAERLMSTAKATYGNPATSFGIVRYGNVWGSRGSVLEAFQHQLAEKGSIELTHASMTRFVVFPREACRMIHEALQRTKNGEVYLWKLPAIRLSDLAREIGGTRVRIVGMRPGEKIHEVLMSKYESMRSRRMPGGLNGERAAYLIHPFIYGNSYTTSWDLSYELSSEVAPRFDEKVLCQKLTHVCQTDATITGAEVV